MITLRIRAVCKQTKWQPVVTHDRKIHKFGGYKNILPEKLTILPELKTNAIDFLRKSSREHRLKNLEKFTQMACAVLQYPLCFEKNHR